MGSGSDLLTQQNDLLHIYTSGEIYRSLIKIILMRCDQHVFLLNRKSMSMAPLSLVLTLEEVGVQISVAAQSYRIIPNNPQLVQDRQSGKEDVADERNYSQLPVQLPSVHMNGYKKKDD